MAIEFDQHKWNRLVENSRLWWSGRLKRPLIYVYLKGHDPGRPAPVLPPSREILSYGLSTPPEQIIDRWEYDLAGMRFLGDAFPWEKPSLGSSSLAVYIGTQFHTTPETVWYEPWNESDITRIQIKYDPENPWLQRTKQIYTAARERWQGRIQLGITNLGGVFDTLAMIMPAERLMVEMHDRPEEVTRLVGEVHNAWWQCFETFSEIIRPNNQGYVDFWVPLLCDHPTFTLQNDFICMIGPDLFERFVRPELEKSCRRLGGAFFHLDGPGALCHLDSLLTIPNLKGIQWIPGAGAADITHWPHIHRKVREAGKLIHIDGSGNPAELDIITEQLGNAEGIVYSAFGRVRDESRFRALLEKYGITD